MTEQTYGVQALWRRGRGAWDRLQTVYGRHRLFVLILLLFVTFRALSILLFRPGGFIADFSDYDYYFEWGRLLQMGYEPYETLWSTYPPLFPAMMLALHELSARIPPWIEPRFFFHTFLGLALLLFETGNLVLIYRLAEHLTSDQRVLSSTVPATLLPVILYALLFTPVFTLIGWFESMPLFFMLLGLDLLLSRGRWGWPASAVAAALGFLTKLTPALLVPVAVRWLGGRLSWWAAKNEWFNPRSEGNLLRPTVYGLTFVATVFVTGYFLVGGNPNLAFSSFRIQNIRPPWQSLWAVLDGYFGFGLVPLDMRNLQGLSAPLWESSLPWTWITAGFILVYLWLYTRPYDWEKPRTVVAFSAVSVIWLFLYSKGWSPQFVVWILAFLVLLSPNLRGMLIAATLMVTNFVEASVFLIMLPDEHWILWGTVLLRTVLLFLVALDFLGQIWPTSRGSALRRVSGTLAWASMAAALLAVLAGTPRAARAYAERRLAEHPCPAVVERLRTEAEWPGDLIVTDRAETWSHFYPWLRQHYDLYILDGYSPDRPAEEVKADRLTAHSAGESAFWWLAFDEASHQNAELPAFFPESMAAVESEQQGACVLSRVVAPPEQPFAVASVPDGSIELVSSIHDEPIPGETLNLVLYWRATAELAESYTVFTQILDASGHMVAQQDNLPVNGLAPTDTWQPGRIVRDPYRLSIPASTEGAELRLLVGLYQETERLLFARPDGTTTDALTFSLKVE